MSNLMPPGWSAHQAPDGRYYFSHVSGVTQWEPPQPQGAAPNTSQPPPPGQYAPAPSAGPSQPPGKAPPQPPSATGAKYIFDRPMEFKLQEKLFSFSGDSFSIKDVQTKQPVFQVKGKAISFKDSKALRDMSGNSIYKMTENILSLRARMQISDAASKKVVLTLRKKGFIPGLGTSTVLAWKGDSDEGEPYLEIKGNFLRKDFNIKEGGSGRVLAAVKRKSLNVSNVVFEKDSYVVKVEAGVDAALMVFMVVALDEMYRDDGNRRGLSSFI